MPYHTGLWTVLVQRHDQKTGHDHELTKINNFGTAKKPVIHKVPKENNITITTFEQFGGKPKVQVTADPPQHYFIIFDEDFTLCRVIFV